MSIFILKKERDLDNEFDKVEITMKLQAETLDEVMEEFGRFLICCGYNAEGVREILHNEDI